jgi:hypothetical protein
VGESLRLSFGVQQEFLLVGPMTLGMGQQDTNCWNYGALWTLDLTYGQRKKINRRTQGFSVMNTAALNRLYLGFVYSHWTLDSLDYKDYMPNL